MNLKLIILFCLICTVGLFAGDWQWINHSDIFMPHGLSIHDHNFTFQILDWYGDGRKMLVVRQGNEYESYIWDKVERKWNVEYVHLPNYQFPVTITGGWWDELINPLYFTIADFDNDGDWDFIYNELWIHENIRNNEHPDYRLVDPYFTVPGISDNYGVYNFAYHPFFLDYDGDGIMDMVVKTRNGNAALCKGDADFNFTYLADVTAGVSDMLIGSLPRLQDFNADSVLDVVNWIQFHQGVGAGFLHKLLYLPQKESDLSFELTYNELEALPFSPDAYPEYFDYKADFISFYTLSDFDCDGDLDLFYTTGDRHILYAPNTTIKNARSDTLVEKWGCFNGEKYARPAFRITPFCNADEFTFIQQAVFEVSSGTIFSGAPDFSRIFENGLFAVDENFISFQFNDFNVKTSPGHNDSFKHNLTISFQDVDGDDIEDMIRSYRHTQGREYLNDNWETALNANDLYLNQGTEESPDWVYEPTLLQKFNDQDTLFLNLVVKDIDGDGLLDALVKRNGIFTFYSNTGTFEQPDWRESRKLYSGLPLWYASQRYLYHCAFADLDHDNIDDLIFGTTYGRLYAYKNMRQDSVQWQQWPNAFNMQVDSFSVPAFSDIDRDGDMDLFIGDKKGFIYFYENASTVRVEDNSPELPVDFHCTNFPNPFNSSTTLSFHLPNTAFVNIEIYDITGRRIQNLTNSQYPPGQHQFTWNGTDEHGLNCATGIYFFRIDINTMNGEQQKVLKASLIR